MERRIVVDGAVFSCTGYGNVVRNLSLALLKRGYDVKFIPRDWANLGDVEGLSDEDAALLRDNILKDHSLVEDSVFLSINIASLFVRRSKVLNVGFSMLETDRISSFWVDRCNQMDLVLVPTSFNVETFAGSGVKVPIEEIPLSVDQDLFAPDKEALVIPDCDTKFNFLVNAQWAPGDRKGIYYLLRSFLEIFRGNPDVGLVMKVFISTDSTYDELECIERVKEIKERLGIDEYPRVYLCNRNLDIESLSRFYHTGDAFVLPTLGESWGLPIHEAIMSGLPVITTGGSAAERYLDGSLVRFLKHRKVQLPEDLYYPRVYERNMVVTLPGYKDLKDALLDMYSNYKFWKIKATLQRERLQYLTWDYSADKFIQSIERYIK